MALARHSGRRDVNIWPGFVDALTALLLILTFVLSIFMIVQFNLREKITGQTQKLDSLNEQLVVLTDTLALERKRAADLESELGTIRATLAAEQARTDDLRAELGALRLRLSEEQEARRLEAAAAEELRGELDDTRKESQERLSLLTAAESERELLGQELVAQTEAFEQQALRVALLNEQLKELNAQLAALQNVLDETAKREAEANVQISNLGAQLNAALARQVSLEAENAKLLAEQVDRLENLRSVFLERVEGALAGREGIERVGDRFVFQSEVLFAAGSAELGEAGQEELARLGEVMRELDGELPADIDWILRIDGHTDRLPIKGGQYNNNWELSQARALSVVTYLIDEEDVAPSRLAATGFGEFQPLDVGSTPGALARNRRIEFKFTER